mmetsp:Transcript_3262/g.11425  ORF Transcript_3262/g.11425 Transcript_3262/m.11425 type:complete len:217 (+) Transcript_3262:3418-4068(+)
MRWGGPTPGAPAAEFVSSNCMGSMGSVRLMDSGTNGWFMAEAGRARLMVVGTEEGALITEGIDEGMLDGTPGMEGIAGLAGMEGIGGIAGEPPSWARPPGRRSNVDWGLFEELAADSIPMELTGRSAAGAVGGIGFSRMVGREGGGGFASPLPPLRPKPEGIEGLGGGPDILCGSYQRKLQKRWSTSPSLGDSCARAKRAALARPLPLLHRAPEGD